MMIVTSPVGLRSGFMPQIYRAPHTDAGGRSVAATQLRGNELAFQQLRDRWPLVPGTQNAVIIEDRSTALASRPVNIAIFDWDETVSKIKCGWNLAMIRYVAKLWAMDKNTNPALAWEQDIEPTDADKVFSERFVRNTTGTITQVQYATAIYLQQFRRAGIGGFNEADFDRPLKNILVKSELDFTHPSPDQPWNAEYGAKLWELGGGMYAEWKNIMRAEFRDRRLVELRDGIAAPEQYLVGNVIPFLNAISSKGIPMYALSGSEQSEVEEDANALTAGHFFRTIYGVNGTLERLTGGETVYSKYNGSNHILEIENVSGSDIERAMWLGDGPSEIKIGKTFGGLRVGLVPAHAEDPTALAETLIENGAQYLILEDFKDWAILVPYFFGK